MAQHDATLQGRQQPTFGLSQLKNIRQHQQAVPAGVLGSPEKQLTWSRQCVNSAWPMTDAQQRGSGMP
jgi:hypothetical protein